MVLGMDRKKVKSKKPKIGPMGKRKEKTDLLNKMVSKALGDLL
jgi:hypothetical protein